MCLFQFNFSLEFSNVGVHFSPAAWASIDITTSTLKELREGDSSKFISIFEELLDE
ncbi:hypothetical protein RST01_16670 [Rummeliibacillus stabekisii]|nr:hypothetical protein RST01_16670 [Rummeliibacillus stabekisii]